MRCASHFARHRPHRFESRLCQRNISLTYIINTASIIDRKTAVMELHFGTNLVLVKHTDCTLKSLQIVKLGNLRL